MLGLKVILCVVLYLIIGNLVSLVKEYARGLLGFKELDDDEIITDLILSNCFWPFLLIVYFFYLTFGVLYKWIFKTKKDVYKRGNKTYDGKMQRQRRLDCEGHI